MSRAQTRGGTRKSGARPSRGARQTKAKRSVFSWVSLISSAVMTAVAVALVVALAFIIESNRPGPTQEDATFVVPRGASVTAIARSLGAEGHIRSAIVFRAAKAIYAGGQPLQAGEYLIPAHAPLRAVIDMIAQGHAVQHPITVAEGLTSQMVLDIVTKSDVLTGDAPAAVVEGSLLPETYQVQRGMDRTTLIAQMHQAQADLIEELWPRRAPGLPFTSPEEAVTLASIVEKETGVASERPRVAAVFINRLRRGMALESDPTIIYGVCQARPSHCANGRLVDERGNPRGIRQSELDLHTGYNTYRIPALPPGPIANPGRAAIEAVLNPPRTNELFFVADGSGGHVFAATLAEHQRNVARWRAIERLRASAR